MTEQLSLDFGSLSDGAEARRPADASEPAAERAEGSGSGTGRASLVDSLVGVADRASLARTLVVARTLGEGRELLRQVARERGGWLGLEVTTLLRLAVELAAPVLAADGRRLLDEFDQQSLLDEAIDDVLLTGRGGPLSHLAEGTGFRATLQRAILTLRLGGVAASRVRRTRLDDAEKKEVLGRVLSRYEALLDRRNLADQATVLARAAEQLDHSDAALAGIEGVHVLPGLGLRGVAGRMLRGLLARGARVLDTDPVHGLAPPESVLWSAGAARSALSYVHAGGSWSGAPPRLELFAASGVTEELREVLRRAMAAGYSWDEVEIVTPDPAVYGSALHALTGTLGVDVSYGVGLPVERTRPGRAIAAYFRWIEHGFGADVIRTLLAAGDLRPPGRATRLTPARLARRLRTLRIGWGRDRYLPLITAALKAARESRQGRHESAAALEGRRAWTIRELDALRSILAPALRDTPRVPAAMDDETRVSPAALARGLASFLRHIPPADAVDRTALERLGRVLDRVQTTLTREVTYRGSASTLRAHLEMRVPAPRAEGRAPWSSAGGHVFLTDLEHGGMTGRPATFVVGLDAVRFPGVGIQDPLLLDRERWRLADDDLPRSTDRQREITFRLAALLSRLRGSVTLSYCAWDPAEARVIPPSLELLLAHRLAAARSDASFEDLRAHLGSPAGPLPRGPARLDARDVWLGSLAPEGRLLEGVAPVRRAFDGLDAGLRAREQAEEPVPNVHHGIVTPRPDALDPRRVPEGVLSASRLESLGRCPRKYLFQTVLRVWVPDDPVLDPERWLDPRHRGDLLHSVYDRTLREARERGATQEELEELALDVLDAEAERKLAEVPTPSPVIRDREMAALRADVQAFVRMVRPALDRWIHTELRFGLQGDPPVRVEVAGGSVAFRGAIDRIDQEPEGLVVVDYKTGKARDFEPEKEPFNGGRRLQNWLYTQVAGARFGRPVVRMTYAFPTERGQNACHTYTPEDLRSGAALVGLLLDGVADGHFVPTDTPEDCLFCDYRDLCRVRDTRDGVASPLADWSSEAMALHAPLLRLRKARRWTD